MGKRARHVYGYSTLSARPAGGRAPIEKARVYHHMMTTYEFASAWLQARCKTDRGASLVEYALLVALIAVVCIVAVTLLGKSASSKFSTVGSSIS
jgi:pilus assembly protein Flp/PilA